MNEKSGAPELLESGDGKAGVKKKTPPSVSREGFSKRL